MYVVAGIVQLPLYWLLGLEAHVCGDIAFQCMSLCMLLLRSEENSFEMYMYNCTLHCTGVYTCVHFRVGCGGGWGVNVELFSLTR